MVEKPVYIHSPSEPVECTCDITREQFETLEARVTEIERMQKLHYDRLEIVEGA